RSTPNLHAPSTPARFIPPVNRAALGERQRPPAHAGRCASVHLVGARSRDPIWLCRPRRIARRRSHRMKTRAVWMAMFSFVVVLFLGARAEAQMAKQATYTGWFG